MYSAELLKDLTSLIGLKMLNVCQPISPMALMMFLKNIPTEEWIPFICNKFRETGKTISEEQVAKICELTENLSSYVQHLAWIVW